ncbi:MAG TPA: 2-C-methyl-D-erythritol 2,4-cyclodiphosphate synthase [Gemmatimonadetes bacterium]|nr:2-C-methyl-D-erythritol 2,4-cyclodiphosphate synthase [Gemmatimonadota bacterium]
MRIGTGYDSHRFEQGRQLMLGGVNIPGHPGLSGHSDGDAIAHAVIDAILGAAAAGDIGSHFPQEDDTWKGADSMDLLEQTRRVLEERGFRVVNIDVTVICERPKIAPHIDAMKKRLGAVLQVTSDRVSIKGKSNEGLGWIGAGEGVAVHSVALIDQCSDFPDSGGTGRGSRTL